MYLKALYLKNFRNYKEASVFFSPHINTIYGDNAQGKTNLLEAIFLVMMGRSFRTLHLSELIYFKERDFYVEAHFEKNGIDQVIKISFSERGRKIFHNHTPIANLSSLLGIMNGVLLSPEDGDLIKGGPAIRRRYLDLQISKTNPLYLYHMMRYERAMKQRNNCLKNQKKEQLAIWEEQMAESAVFLTEKRLETVNEVEACSLHPLFDPLRLFYRSSALTHISHQISGEKWGLNSCKLINKKILKEYFLNLFQSSRTKELIIGTTLHGPHRDDLDIFVNEKHARSFASEGQQRCSAALLRFAEWERLKRHTEDSPLLCIDDVGVSLDQKREQALYNHLEKKNTQVFLTSPRLASFAKCGNLISISSGIILQNCFSAL